MRHLTPASLGPGRYSPRQSPLRLRPYNPLALPIQHIEAPVILKPYVPCSVRYFVDSPDPDLCSITYTWNPAVSCFIDTLRLHAGSWHGISRLNHSWSRTEYRFHVNTDAYHDQPHGEPQEKENDTHPENQPFHSS